MRRLLAQICAVVTVGVTLGIMTATSANASRARISNYGNLFDIYQARNIGPQGIATGPDGAMWFTDLDNNSIGRISMTGQVTSYTDPAISLPYGIVAGPDGALWFTNSGSGSIGRITTSGQLSFYGAGSLG